MKKFIVLFLFLLVACAQNSKVDDNTLNVVVSFYPLEEFTKSIGGEKVTVKTLIPSGVEPHEWEPSPQDIIAVQNADVFIFNGAGLEPWAERVINIVDTKKTILVDSSKDIELIKFEEEHGTFDPHIWLDPLRVVQQVENIKKGLTKADASGAEFYEFNARKQIEQLKGLHAKLFNSLSGCRKKEFITSHEAFNYFAKRYDLVQIPIAGFSPEEEPTPQHIASLIKLIKEKNITTIFVETLVHPRVAEALAKDTNSKTESLNPFEGLTEEEHTVGLNYFSVTEQNVNKLKDALDCS
ncbi:zinc ABC transporter substrate-binding protein [Candidatus Woesearchaeota archaeon]|nr:zinc ABC transporter substrate-binding protein [Candidatus Woesearchaeota archaeon]